MGIDQPKQDEQSMYKSKAQELGRELQEILERKKLALTTKLGFEPLVGASTVVECLIGVRSVAHFSSVEERKRCAEKLREFVHSKYPNALEDGYFHHMTREELVDLLETA